MSTSAGGKASSEFETSASFRSKGQSPHQKRENVDSTDDSFISSQNIDIFKMFCASVVVTLLVIVDIVGIANRYCILQLHPAINFTLLIAALTLLAYVEALHYACVAVEKWDMSRYKEKYPRAVACQALVDTPEKVKKFLVGRQFFVIFVVFLIAEITSFPYMPTDFAGMPPTLVTVLVKTGLPGIALVLTFGQLISQIFVEEYTLPFLNLLGCEFCIRLALAAEYIGICHFSWMLYNLASMAFFGKVRKLQQRLDDGTVSKSDYDLEEFNEDRNSTDMKSATSSDPILEKDLNKVQKNSSLTLVVNANDSRKSANPKEPQSPASPHTQNRGPNFDNGIPKISFGSIFEILKYMWSTAATVGSLAVLIYGISKKAYTLPVGVVAAYFIAIFDLTLLFYLEGLMIAVVGCQYWNKETWRTMYPRAYNLHEILNRPDNDKRFIIGRQFFTVLTGFLLAQIFSFPAWESGSYNKVLFFICVQSGLPGVMVVLAFGQLLPELLAAEFPLRFMNIPGSYSVGYMSLIFDKVGVGHAAWSVYYVAMYVKRKFFPEEGDQEDNIVVEKPKMMTIFNAEILISSPTKKQSSSSTSPPVSTVYAKV